MNHTPPILLSHGKNTIAYFALNAPKTLVVFVHGFNGSAIDTWNDFPRLLRSENRFREADIVFYGYESLKGQANNNALRFYSCLKELVKCNPRVYGFDRRQAIDQRYDKIIIAAHSLGAIIVRRALLNAKAENKNWLPSVRMILFAPAHRGARIQKLVNESVPGWGKLIIGLGFIKYPVLDDLRPDSETIQGLIRDTQAHLNNNDGHFTIAHEVIWANNEVVVHNERFCNDPIANLVDGKGHMKVCKPANPNYVQPMDSIINAL